MAAAGTVASAGFSSGLIGFSCTGSGAGGVAAVVSVFSGPGAADAGFSGAGIAATGGEAGAAGGAVLMGSSSEADEECHRNRGASCAKRSHAANNTMQMVTSRATGAGMLF